MPAMWSVTAWRSAAAAFLSGGPLCSPAVAAAFLPGGAGFSGPVRLSQPVRRTAEHPSATPTTIRVNIRGDSLGSGKPFLDAVMSPQHQVPRPEADHEREGG